LHPAKDQLKRNGKAKADAEPATDYVPRSLDFSTLPVMPLPTYATSATTKRLLSELQSLSKVQERNSPVSLGWSIDTEKIENVYQWIVELHSFHTFSINNKPLPLVNDMKEASATSIVLEIRFGPDFPYSPPYIRVIRPRFLPFTQGGGGHIVIGGAMCMELLTNSGWSSVMSMENVLLQVRMAIASEPFARLESKGKVSSHRSHDYGTGEAAEGYLRACQSHGWKVPPGFREVAHGMNSAHTSSGADA
jgi:ubiquitin-conjugating enzyme E2 Q